MRANARPARALSTNLEGLEEAPAINPSNVLTFHLTDMPIGRHATRALAIQTAMI